MRMDIPEQKKWVFDKVIAIRWGDMDAMGHLNNASYFRFLETARIDWMTHIGCTPLPTGEGPVIVNAFCNFYKQFEYPGDVLIKMYVSEPGRSSFESWATLERTDMPGVIHATGGATTVWVDFLAQKSVPMPDWFKEIIS
ncbi:MAG: acyl-CoA thioesterase [Limnohabitans sp.]